ncbi:MAG: hypothetical protein M0Z87_02475 [Actinomycetota bacterium]|nr:hypothetical protein [Actinomycetota bacterium]
MVVVALAILWMVVLTPVVLRKCDEASPAGPVRAFRMQLAALRNRGACTIPPAHRLGEAEFHLLDIPPLVPAFQPLRPSYIAGRYANRQPASTVGGSRTGDFDPAGTATALLDRPRSDSHLLQQDTDVRPTILLPSTLLPAAPNGPDFLVDEIRAAAVDAAARSAARRSRIARSRQRRRQQTVLRRMAASVAALAMLGLVPGAHALLVAALLDGVLLIGYAVLLSRHRSRQH